MKRKTIPVEFVYQLFALIISIIIVHAVYVSMVRPNATEVLEQQAIEAAANPDYIRERSTWVLIKDLEQEACFVLMFWALAIMGYKAREILRERNLLDVDLVPIAEGMRILPEDTREFARQVEALPDDHQGMLLPRSLMNALRRFNSTRNIQDVSSSTNIVFESEADRLESELSMRFLRSDLSAPSVVSVRRSPRRTRPCRAISPALPRVWALPSTRRLSRS